LVGLSGTTHSCSSPYVILPGTGENARREIRQGDGMSGTDWIREGGLRVYLNDGYKKEYFHYVHFLTFKVEFITLRERG
jgi:hypothetical protein